MASARMPAGALAGAVAAGAALGAGELAAGVLPGAVSPVVAVADLVVDFSPGAVVETGIGILGTADKPVLLAAVVVLALAFGALAGAGSARRPATGLLAIGAFALLGAAAALRDPRAGAAASVAAVAIAAVAGAAALRALLRRATAGAAAGEDAPSAGAWSRRSFLRAAGMVAAASVTAGTLGRALGSRASVAAARSAVALPQPAEPVAAPPAAASLAVAGIAPLITPNADFYRIDTALVAPQVDPESWTLRVHGLVERPFEMTFAELLSLPSVEEHVTLACVSNEVGGDLVGTARWQGVPLAAVLDRAGVRAEATQIIGRSVDGFTAGFPTATLDGRTALVAYGMNGEPLPVRHGFPARLVVAGLYGYVSATMWLSEIELTRLEDVDGYWIPRGWSKEAPVKTQSRIDVPRQGATVPAGPAAIAGVAWAPVRGIAAVEVRVDDGPWEAARLAAAIGDETWRQWVYRWDARPGVHTIRVRATDGDAVVQTEEIQRPAPDGATGHHTIDVLVR